MPDDHVSNWHQALDTFLPLETVRLILKLAYEFEEQFGRRITAEELRASLMKPSV